MPRLFLIQCPISRVNDEELPYHTIAIYCAYDDKETQSAFRREAELVAKYRMNYPRAMGSVYEVSRGIDLIGLDVKFFSQRFGSEMWCHLKRSGIEGLPLRPFEVDMYLRGIETEIVQVEEEIEG